MQGICHWIVWRVSSKNFWLFAHSLLAVILKWCRYHCADSRSINWGVKLDDKGIWNWSMWLIITLFVDMDSEGPGYLVSKLKINSNEAVFSGSTKQNIRTYLLIIRHWCNKFEQRVWYRNCVKCFFLQPANEVWGKVMFSQVFVCPHGVASQHASQVTWPASGGGGLLPNMHPPELGKWAVHILVECFLVTVISGFWHLCGWGNCSRGYDLVIQ